MGYKGEGYLIPKTNLSAMEGHGDLLGPHPAQGHTQTHQDNVQHLNRRKHPPKCPSKQNNYLSSNDCLSQAPQNGHVEPYLHVSSQMESGWSKADVNPAVTPLQVPTARQGPCDASGLALVPVPSRCEMDFMSQYMVGPGDLLGCHDLFRPSLPRDRCVLSLLSPKAALLSPLCLASGCTFSISCAWCMGRGTMPSTPG